MARVPITILVEPAVAAQMERRAAAMSLSVQDYAGRCFAAGYAARAGVERGMPSTDEELDAAVRAVFMLAGNANTRTIAKVTGLARSLVENILRGFKAIAAERQAAALAACREPEEIAPVAVPAAEPVATGAAGKRNPRRYTPEEIDVIRTRYAAGDIVADIAAAVGRSVGSLEMYISQRRDQFPHRRKVAPA